MKWKHSRDRLVKNKYCGVIVDKRTVFCICGQKVSLDNDYNDSRLNKYSKNSKCKVNNKKKQLGLPGLFSVLPNSKKSKDSLLSPSLPSLPPSSPLLSTLSSIKPCSGLSSEQITSYINRTPSTYGGARRREIIGKEMFLDRFSSETGFSFKKLKGEEITQFNNQIISKSEWFIDRVEFWTEFANKAIQRAFEQKPVFKGLCYIMLQVSERKEHDKDL
ncbi:hypothetical protein C2G38_2044479 [Gigaspora rosea]|uniref:Uncharacterized protein n=1 Tax=Gigaspora rosea TaxID=44941 RepID=A0A397UIB8_9GLOM|nr:hypothetical protein C2G38_2044479 [Gigaspora rosea]